MACAGLSGTIFYEGEQNMKMYLKKLLAVLLTLVLVLGVFPAAAFAAGDNSAREELPEEYIGGYIPFSHPGSQAITNAYLRGDLETYNRLSGKTATRATIDHGT